MGRHNFLVMSTPLVAKNEMKNKNSPSENLNKVPLDIEKLKRKNVYTSENLD